MEDFGVYGLGKGESSWGRKRGEVNGVLTCGNSHKAKMRDITLQVQTIRKEIRSIRVHLTPENETEF